ncbi:DedA family protein [Paenibacillus aceti]|uniref:Membrane protein YbfM n=1 Tax=Paenibacillus aceti TaxID=1820010 RepID=A0ABQ1W766_9BACL|nr:DedA family protein [Paenibacillus aceti]GGG18460.1 putative membrane protein YbfM [Paenibacillus aceti]
MDKAILFISQYGYGAIFVLLALGIVGLPIPDETLMVFVGYLASERILNYFIALIISFIGSVAGMAITYLIGRQVGSSVIVKYGKWVGLTPKRYDKVKKWFDKYGTWTIVFAYFIPGVRHASGYMSGVTCLSFRRYLLFCCTGALVWTILFISLGYFIGAQLLQG